MSAQAGYAGGLRSSSVKGQFKRVNNRKIIDFIKETRLPCEQYSIAILAVEVLSVRPSVCLSVCLSHARYVTKPYNALWIFWYHTKGQSLYHSGFLTPTVLGGQRPFRLKFALKVTHPFEKRRLRQISAYNVSTVRDSEKVHPWRTGSRPRAFQRAIDGVRTFPLSSPKNGSKAIFLFF